MTSSLLVCVARACKLAQYTFISDVSFSAYYWASQLPLTVSLEIGTHLPLYAVFQTFELKGAKQFNRNRTKQKESILLFWVLLSLSDFLNLTLPAFSVTSFLLVRVSRAV